VALVLASEALRKFGGDSLAEFVRNHDAHRRVAAMTPNTFGVSRVDGREVGGGRCAGTLDRPLVDTDDEIVLRRAMPIDEIFQTGERRAASLEA
jgi:hypothetical protein